MSRAVSSTNFKRRGWTYADLASRMTGTGCAINPSSVHKVLKQVPPRRITVDELGALADVFDVPIGDRARPLTTALGDEIEALVSDLPLAQTDVRGGGQSRCRERQSGSPGLSWTSTTGATRQTQSRAG